MKTIYWRRVFCHPECSSSRIPRRFAPLDRLRERSNALALAITDPLDSSLRPTGSIQNDTIMNFGKLFIIGFDSLVLTEELKEKLLKLEPAGVILYDCNIESKDQVKKLISDLKNLLGEDLLVSVDQEGGKVQRLRKICTDLPSLKALGIAAQKDESYLELHSRTLAIELVELGFNLVYAPCADLNTNPANPIIGSRSLGKEPAIVSKQLTKIHNSYRDSGLISCAKHYPGHGDAGVDSHLDLPLIKRTKEENDFHLRPFKALIKNNIEMIMIAHLVINEGLPASINPEIINKLRKELDFKGIVISDEITMKALSQFGDYSKIAELLIKAGNNLIIWNTNLDDALRTADYLNILSQTDKELKRHCELSLKIIHRHCEEWQNCYDVAIQTKNPKLDCDASLAMTEIAKLGIEIKNKKPISLEDFVIVINNHPKLEKETILSSLRGMNEVNDVAIQTINESRINSNKFAILIEFQIKDSELKLIHGQIKPENLLHVSTDICHPEADICLNGASVSHYQALKKLLTNN